MSGRKYRVVFRVNFSSRLSVFRYEYSDLKVNLCNSGAGRISCSMYMIVG
jgi:hypothetical protein